MKCTPRPRPPRAAAAAGRVVCVVMVRLTEAFVRWHVPPLGGDDNDQLSERKRPDQTRQALVPGTVPSRSRPRPGGVEGILSADLLGRASAGSPAGTRPLVRALAGRVVWVCPARAGHRISERVY